MPSTTDRPENEMRVGTPNVSLFGIPIDFIRCEIVKTDARHLKNK